MIEPRETFNSKNIVYALFLMIEPRKTFNSRYTVYASFLMIEPRKTFNSRYTVYVRVVRPALLFIFCGNLGTNGKTGRTAR